MLASVDWKNLLQIDGQVARIVVERFNREPETMIELESREVFAGIVSFDRKLQKQLQVVDDVYRQTEAIGLKSPTVMVVSGYSIGLNVISRGAYSSS